MTQANPVDQSTGNRLVFEDSTEVQAPISDVYRRWSNFSSFPEFMENVEEVRSTGGNRYHWTARIFGIKQEWDAEVTDMEPNRRVSWRSLTGAYNAGTVSFSELSPTSTEVRVRLEYAPPAGKVGQALDQVTQTTKREVHEDLQNFKRLITGQSSDEDLLNGQGATGFGRVMSALSVPVAVGLAGGTIGYFLEKSSRENTLLPKPVSPVETPAATAGWVFTAASAASVIASATLRSRGDRANSLFVGQWAPTLLESAILARVVGHRGIKTPLTVAAGSWALSAACLGSIASSVVLHARGKRTDGLFVGQWAPTFLGAAILTRIFGR